MKNPNFWWKLSKFFLLLWFFLPIYFIFQNQVASRIRILYRDPNIEKSYKSDQCRINESATVIHSLYFFIIVWSRSQKGWGGGKKVDTTEKITVSVIIYLSKIKLTC